MKRNIIAIQLFSIDVACFLCHIGMYDARIPTRRNLFPNNQQKIESFYIVGATSKEKSVPVLSSLLNTIKSDSSKNKNVIFIGDNINEKKKEAVKEDLDREISFVKNAGIPSYFVPGNYEWDFNATEGLETIEDYLEENLKMDDPLVPNNGCPLESIDINPEHPANRCGQPMVYFGLG